MTQQNINIIIASSWFVEPWSFRKTVSWFSPPRVELLAGWWPHLHLVRLLTSPLLPSSPAWTSQYAYFMVLAFSRESSTAGQVPTGGLDPAKCIINALPEVVCLFYQVCMRLDLCGLWKRDIPQCISAQSETGQAPIGSVCFKGGALNYVLWKVTKPMNWIFRTEKHRILLPVMLSLRPL